MENKNLDGQLSLDGDLGLGNPENTEKTEKKEIHTVEFEIGTPAKKENLIFEVSKEAEKKEDEEKPTVSIEDVVDEFVIGTPPALKKAPAPEETGADSNAEQEINPAPAPRRGVYIPRFTEASEKYRKTVDTRSRASAYELRRSAIVEVENSSIGVESFNTENIDPTAEIDVAPVSQVVVNVSNPEPEPDMLNVFKFRTEEEPEKPVAEEATLESEIAEIESIIAPVTESDSAESEESADAVEDMAIEPVFEEENLALEETANKEDNYVLPDPDASLAIQDYNAEESVAPEETPDFVVADEARGEKRRNSEFTHQSQRDNFKDKFLDVAMAHKIRIGMIGIFAIALLVFELLAFLGVFTPRFIRGSSYLGTLAMFDFLLVACVFLISMPETVGAIKNLVKKKATFELALPLGFVVTLIYYIVLMISPAKHYDLYGFVFSIYALVAVIAGYYRNSADFIAFKQVSKNYEKKILDVKMTRDLPEENVALDGLVDEYNSKTSRIFRVAFVADFFDRVSKTTEKGKRVLTLLAIPFVAALISAVIALIVPGGIVAALSAFTLVFLVSCPAFVMLSGKIPYFDAQSCALNEESAVLGEKSYIDFSEVDVIAFEDTEIFGVEDVNLKRFMLYGERDNIERAMRQMYSLFSVVGSPLYKIFANALDNRVRHTPATDVQIETDGVSGEISGNRVFAGTETYMRRHGIVVPQSSGHSDVGVDTTKIMYAAENGEVHAKFYIRYSFSEEFTMLLPLLRKEGIVPLIYSNDPNLSNELLKILCAGADCMRVVKKLEPRPETEKIYRRVSAGVVTFGDKINAINTILLTRKYKQFSDRIAVSALYSMSIAAAATLIISAMGAAIPSLVYGVWHIGWCAALRLVSRKNFSEEKKDSNK